MAICPAPQRVERTGNVNGRQARRGLRAVRQFRELGRHRRTRGLERDEKRQFVAAVQSGAKHRFVRLQNGNGHLSRRRLDRLAERRTGEQYRLGAAIGGISRETVNSPAKVVRQLRLALPVPGQAVVEDMGQLGVAPVPLERFGNGRHRRFGRVNDGDSPRVHGVAFSLRSRP